MATFSRSTSACVDPVKFWKPGMMPAGMPVSRIASRSARSASRRREVREDAGYSTGSNVASSGRATYWANSESASGPRAFHRSLAAIGTMTSLNSGFPRRDTWHQGPELSFR